MKTREVEFEPGRSEGSSRRRKGLWLAGAGAVLVAVLVIGASAFVFAQSSYMHRQSQAHNLPTGKWVQVLSGYTVSSVVEADSVSSVLYACATRAQLDVPLPGLPPNRIGTGNPVYTVLKSIDAGTHWLDVGGKADLGGSCQVVVNPADSNELFAVGAGTSNGQTAGVLKHSSDGGVTWTTIQPVLNLPGSQSGQPAQVWNVQQLSMAGGHLFGVQWIARHVPPIVIQGPPPTYAPPLARLVTSSDGGHSWTVLDSQFISTRQEERAYAVDPTNANTIYELVGLSWWPLQPGVTEPNDVLPSVGRDGNLYKTTDAGANWHLILKGLPFGGQVHVQLVRGDAQMIYAGGVASPIPYMAGAPASNMNGAGGSFDLQLSRDGGASWHAVPAIPRQGSMQNWFADTQGEVFADVVNLYASPGTQPTASIATAVAATPVRIPAGTPQSGIPALNGDVSVAAEPTPVVPGSGTPGFSVSIERYDPIANAWSAFASPPANGVLLALTPGGTNGDVLWFMGVNKGEQVLYRYQA